MSPALLIGVLAEHVHLLAPVRLLEEVLLGCGPVLRRGSGVARDRLDGAARRSPLMWQGLQHRRLLRRSRPVRDVEPGWELC